MIEFDNVCFSYLEAQANNRTKILNNLSFKVDPHEFIAIIGKSGSGKTTILKLITNQLRQCSGSIKVNGYNLPVTGDKEISEYRDSMSVVLQKGALFREMTVYENIAFPISNQKLANTKELVYSQLNDWELPIDCINYYPYQLSGGMIQKVAIARANIIKKPIVIYDEPCAGLDPESTKHITNLMYNVHISYKQTVLLITHNQDLAYKLADRVLLLEDGKINVVLTNNNK
jgi:phospholipid/cholesterol/gamma-HCH transport system ATP-binding protein